MRGPAKHDDDLTVLRVDAESDAPPATPRRSGWAPRRDHAERDEVAREDAPTREMDRGAVGYASRIDEIRRLYAAGDAEDALLLAGTVSPPPPLRWSLASVPVLAMKTDELVRLPLDHRAGFLLSHVDGASSFETLLDLVPLPESEVIGIVESLLALGVIRLEDRGTRRTPT